MKTIRNYVKDFQRIIKETMSNFNTIKSYLHIADMVRASVTMWFGVNTTNRLEKETIP
jgi:hypothetical protein